MKLNNFLVAVMLLGGLAGRAVAEPPPQAPYVETDPGTSDNIRELYRRVAEISSGTTGGAVAGTIPGEIRMWPAATAPSGWYICDGSTFSRTGDAGIYAVIGTTFGTGDGSTTANLPNFQRRVPVGAGGSGTATIAATIGSTGGEETHTLSIAEMPAHHHTETARLGAAGGPNFAVRLDGSADTVMDTTYNTTLDTGGGGAHNVRDPSLVINFIIKQ